MAKAQTIKIDVTAATREYKDKDGKPISKTIQVDFPLYDEKLQNLILFFDNDPEKVYDIVYAAQKIVFQNEARTQLEAEMKGEDNTPAGRRNDSNLNKLKGR